MIADERLVRARGALGRRGAEHADVVEHEQRVARADDGEVAAEHGARARDVVIRGREQRPVLHTNRVLQRVRRVADAHLDHTRRLCSDDQT